MDYWNELEVFEYKNWNEFIISKPSQKGFFFSLHMQLNLCGQLITLKVMACYLGMKVKGHQSIFMNGLEKIVSQFQNSITI